MKAMTDTGGFAFLIAWSTFITLCLILGWTITRRRGRQPEPQDRARETGQDGVWRPHQRNEGAK
jgi:hypothetical protein